MKTIKGQEDQVFKNMAALAGACLIALAVVVTPAPGAVTDVVEEQQSQQEFEWSGRIAPGKTLEVKGVNGRIVAEGVSGNLAAVEAVKKGKKQNPSTVQIEVIEHDGGVTICAVYPAAEGKKPNKCAPGNEGRLSSHKNDVQVAFTVRVPEGVKFNGSTVNGEVEAENLTADVRLSTVNGDVTVSTSGVAQAITVNGTIRAALGRADWSGDLDFNTVNGSIVLDLPADLSATVSAQTVNGSIHTDFPLTVKGRFSSKKLTGTIGDGGRELDLQTVNGSIELNRAR
jgi:DUF4097 and DUF4098 domain-containing protein YvlB